jgi:RNA 3'-terminal phosphate cyclase
LQQGIKTTQPSQLVPILRKTAKWGPLSKASSFTTNELSSHLKTNMEVIKKFLPVNFQVEQQKQLYTISCQPM